MRPLSEDQWQRYFEVVEGLKALAPEHRGTALKEIGTKAAEDREILSLVALQLQLPAHPGTGLSTELPFQERDTVIEAVQRDCDDVCTQPVSNEARKARRQPMLGRYPIVGNLGAGGMGEVLKVYDDQLGRQIAVKVIRGQVNSWTLARFVREGRITGQLEHPGIVPVYELASSADGTVYFTMKEVQGDDLSRVLEQDRQEWKEWRKRHGSARHRTPARRASRRRPVSSARLAAAPPPRLIERLTSFLKICEALSFAHARGVIHRDLKPANIMIGQFGEVQVMDWGLAKVVGQAEEEIDLELSPCAVDAGSGDPDLTGQGSVLGTPAYMPPEQARGDIAQLDQRSDIYSLGAILYEILSLRPPYTGENALEVIAQVNLGKLIPPSQRAPLRTIPWELEAVVVKAMKLRQQDRYSRVELMRQELQAFLDGRTLSAARYSAGQRLVKWAKRHRQKLLAATAGLAAVSALLLGGLWLRDEMSRRETVARLREQARHAHRVKDWTRAVGLTQRALALEQGDPELKRLLAQSNRELARREQTLRRKEERARRYRELQQRLKPLAARLEAARSLFYIPRIDLQKKLEPLRNSMAELVRLTRDPRWNDYPDPWRLLGESLALVGQDEPALKALLEAEKRKALPELLGRTLGPLYTRMAMQASLGSRSAKQRVRMLFSKARRWGEAAQQGEVSETSLNSRLRAAFLLLAAGRNKQAVEHARRTLEDFPDGLRSENLWLLIAMNSGRGSSRPNAGAAIEACNEAIKRRPHYAWAYEWRGVLRLTLKDVDGARLRPGAQDQPAIRTGLPHSRHCAKGKARSGRGDQRFHADDQAQSTQRSCLQPPRQCAPGPGGSDGRDQGLQPGARDRATTSGCLPQPWACAQGPGESGGGDQEVQSGDPDQAAVPQGFLPSRNCPSDQGGSDRGDRGLQRGDQDRAAIRRGLRHPRLCASSPGGSGRSDQGLSHGAQNQPATRPDLHQARPCAPGQGGYGRGDQGLRPSSSIRETPRPSSTAVLHARPRGIRTGRSEISTRQSSSLRETWMATSDAGKRGRPRAIWRGRSETSTG